SAAKCSSLRCFADGKLRAGCYTYRRLEPTFARRTCEPQLEQGDADWKPRQGSRGTIDIGWQSRGVVFHGHRSELDRGQWGEAGEDGVAQVRGVEQQVLHAGGHRRTLFEEGRSRVRRGQHRISPVSGQGQSDAL